MHPMTSENPNTLKLSPEDAKELSSLVTLLWGAAACDSFSTVFIRWSQGFVFSSEEQSALVQNAGGKFDISIPCCLIIYIPYFQVHAV